ncbi:hypothetical protein CDL12_01902 [Handroanthus impetiginosus]|uniref:Uncharacterized protein n=1 Tax=Handroanthus impetiginosus TaxID=429701 RepID=A0A2G9I6G2_9LAMI|nr:hypothetical protein CDL12_01902 [Handroanthus impetiginosus]
MHLFKWTCDFDFQHESAIAPIRVRFEKLSLHLYHKATLFTIGELLGHPLKIDEVTRLRSQTNYARLCVEIDLQKSISELTKIKWDDELISITVVFEKLSKYCTYCKHVGHYEYERYIRGPQPKPKKRFFSKAEAKDRGKTTLEETETSQEAQQSTQGETRLERKLPDRDKREAAMIKHTKPQSQGES